jgi:YafQ family addiction module toxin component
MYSVALSSNMDGILRRLVKKNRKQYAIVLKKIEEIVRNPHRYKNLRAPLNHLKRVHVDKHFVLTFSIDEEEHAVILMDLDHHDNIYRH